VSVRPGGEAGRGAAEATSAGPARARSFGGTARSTGRAWTEDAGAEAAPRPASPPRHVLPLVALALVLVACGRKALPVAPELVRPDPVEDLAAISTPEGVRLTWLRPLRYSGGQRMNDLGSFLIERAAGEGAAPEFAPIGRLELEDQARFRKERHLDWTDRSAEPGRRYLYRVTAITLDRYESAPAGPVAIRFGPPAPPPARPGVKEPR
jgi:hypothetical protein